MTLDLPLPNVQGATQEKIYIKFGFPIGQIIDWSKATFTELGEQRMHYTFLLLSRSLKCTQIGGGLVQVWGKVIVSTDVLFVVHLHIFYL